MLSLTQEQRMLVESVRELAANEFADDAFTWGGEIPWPNVEILRDRGFFGINIDEEYGGGGMSEVEALLLIEVIGRICPDTARTIHTQHFVANSVSHLGTDAAKEKYVRPMIEDGQFICNAISEPEAGSDVGNMNTRVEEENGELVLNGEKIWVSEGGQAATALVWAKFEEGLGSLVVPMDAPGVEIEQEYTNMSDHDQAHIRFTDVVVPEEDVLVRGKGFKEQLKTINWERVSSAAMSNAKALCALEKSLDYAEGRVQFDQPIVEFQGVGHKIADMATKIQASRALTHEVTREATESESGMPDRLHSSMVKLFAANMVDEVVDDALQVHGANGFQKGHPIEYLYRISRRWRIAGGTDEIQKNGILSVLRDDGVEPLLL